MLHGKGLGGSQIHEQWAICKTDADFSFGDPLGTLPLRKYGNRLPRQGPANDFGTTRFTDLSATANSWPPSAFFSQVVGQLTSTRCDYVNGRVTLQNGWTKPTAPADVPFARMEWCYDIAGDGARAATRSYVASMAETPAVAGEKFTAKYVGWQFWTDAAYKMETLDAKAAQRFGAEPNEFPQEPVPVDTWYQAIIDRLNFEGAVPMEKQRMASFTVHVYSGQKLTDYIAGVANGTIPFGPP